MTDHASAGNVVRRRIRRRAWCVRRSSCWCALSCACSWSARSRPKRTSCRPARWRRRCWAASRADLSQLRVRRSWSGSTRRGSHRQAGLPELRPERPGPRAGRRVRRRPGAGAEVPLRFPPPRAVGSGGLPLSRRADSGLCEACRGAAGRVDPDRGRRRLRSTARSSGRSLDEMRAMRILVHDSRFCASRFRPVPALGFPASAITAPAGERLEPVRTAGSCTSGRARAMSRMTGWTGSSTSTGIPSRGRYGPVRDFYGYNGGDLRRRQRGCRPGARGAADTSARTSR